MDADPIRDRLEAYALGALDADEAAAVAHHLTGCPECRRRLAEFEQTASALPEALAAFVPPPPPHMKTGLLASLPDAAGGPASIAAAAPARLGASPRAPSPFLPAPGPPQPRRWGAAAVLARLAAVVLLLVSIGWSVRLAVALDRERDQRAELAALVGRQEVVLEVIDSDKTAKLILRTTRPDTCEPGVTCPYGKVFTRSDLPHVVAMAARLPPPPAGQVYHLWLTRDGRTELAGTMATDDKGFGLLVLDADRDGPVYQSAELTLQAAGATAPTGVSVLRSEASAP